MAKQWALKKNGKYLSGLFCDPLEFNATRTQDRYLYSVEQIARDVAAKAGAEVEEVLTGVDALRADQQRWHDSDRDMLFPGREHGVMDDLAKGKTK
jgi:hypothetical protein